MLTPKQIEIFGAFMAQPYIEKTYGEIKRYSKEKSNSALQKAISKFLAEGLVVKRKVGNIILYKPNIENTAVHSYFNILIREQLPKPVKLCLKIIKQETDSISFLSSAVFGSYSENKQKEGSDLDIALFVNADKDKKSCQLAMKSAELKCVLDIDAHIFTKKEMLEMLKDKDENLGKEIARKHIAICNPEIFYSIINQGIANGFKIVP